VHAYTAEKVLHHNMSAASQDLIVYPSIVEELHVMSKESFYDLMTFV
jgi:hypothetical protein